MASQNEQPFHWHFAELDDQDFEVHGLDFLLLIVAFAVLLLLTLLCLYARWALRYHLRRNQQSHLSSASPVPPAGLDQATIQSFPVKLHHAGPDESQPAECPICLGLFADMEKVKVLPVCHHTFHPKCVDIWLASHRNCPLCRAVLDDGLESSRVA